MAASNEQPIIYKKIKKAAHVHHGGAWKIAYADFVTAMMAFFLLMWLISMTTPEQKQGLADYFAPANVSRSTSGSNGVMGGTAFDEDGSRMPGSAPQIAKTVSVPEKSKSPDEEDRRIASSSNGNSSGTQSEDKISAALRGASTSRDDQNFRSAAESIRQAIQENPDLAEMSKNVIIDQTPEGLRIQLVDEDGRSMFPSGHAEPYERTRQLLQTVSKILLTLPNRISISGHTDSVPYRGTPGYTNWELTADRANAARRILQNAGVQGDRIYQVVGKADTEPLYPEDPYMAANRRLAIVLLREAPVTPPGLMP